MVFKIGKFRAGLWVFILAAALLMAALYKIPGVYRSNALLECLPSIAAGLLTVMGVYVVGAMAGIRVGIIAAALLLGNFAFLETGRSVSTNPDFFVLALQCWLFFGVMLLRRTRLWPFGLAVMLTLSMAAFASWPYEATPVVWHWRGIITGVFGFLGAWCFLLRLLKRRTEDLPIWLGAILWGIFNLIVARNPLVMTLAPAALLGSWLLSNCAHTRGIKIISDGILLALRLAPVFMIGLWVFSWWGTRDNGIEIPMLLPLITLAVMAVVSLWAVRSLKYVDRRVIIVICAACCVAVWQLMLVEPVRLQQNPPRSRPAEPTPQHIPVEAIDVDIEPVLRAAP